MTDPCYAVIAGVNKAGTTSLFVSLSSHPDIAASAIKETRYFSPVRYGRALEPVSVWERYFAAAPDRPVRLEATPSYFYGGAPLAECMAARLGNVRVILLFREPVARAVSFFSYQKTRLRIPAEMTMPEYLAIADELTPDDFRDPENEKYMAVRGSRYAEFLPGWTEALGADRLRVVYFEDLLDHPGSVLRGLAQWLDLDPDAFTTAGDLSSENRTVGYKNVRLQKLALFGNDRLERLFRRHPAWERRLRDVYYRVNGRSDREGVPQAVRDDLARRFEVPNAQLAVQLRTAGYAMPSWLRDASDMPAPEGL